MANSKTSNNLQNNSHHRPLRNAIKLVSNAAIVLTCRELLILFINWSLKQQENKVKKSENYNENQQICLSSNGNEFTKGYNR